MKVLQNLLIEKTAKTPLVDFNQLTGDLILSGRSIPENAAKLYDPLLGWVNEYIENPYPTTSLRLDLEYFNTSSAIWLGKMLKLLSQINQPDFVLIIHLYLSLEDYDDINKFDDIKEAFSPITAIINGADPSIGIKLYGKDDNGEIIKETLVFIEPGINSKPEE